MKSFQQILMDARLKNLMEDVSDFKLDNKICDVFFATNHVILFFKKNTPLVLLKELQIAYKGTLIEGRKEDAYQFIYRYEL